MSAPTIVADFATPDDYLAAHDAEVSAGGLLVRGAVLPAGAPASSCTLMVRISNRVEAELPATIASVAPGTGVAVIFLSEPRALHELAARLREPPVETEEDASEIEHLGLPERIKLAQSAARPMRMKLLRDRSKMLHLHVLKNPRITLEEVQWAARQPTLAPDALQLIGEHPEWAHNATVATALVRNPRYPIPLALRLLSRVPAAELRSIAKGNGRPPIVQAARRLVIG